MPTLKAIRRRISSIRSTQQITRAMKLVAAARLRRAQEALESASPYHDALGRIANSLLHGPEVAPRQGEETPDRAFIVVVASDRGLCGAYNVNIARRAEEEASRARKEQSEVSFFPVGRKVLDHFRRAGTPIAGERINNTPRLATVGLARDLGSLMLEQWRSGAIKEAGVIYSHFRSAMSQQPLYERLLPVAEPAEGEHEQVTDYLMEPSREELIPVVLRSYLEASLLNALLEAEASEYGAKMTAMDAATNNASEIISNLTLEMNRARQATITKELMDIVGGAEALRG